MPPVERELEPAASTLTYQQATNGRIVLPTDYPV
jgi:hypothetical protein